MKVQSSNLKIKSFRFGGGLLLLLIGALLMATLLGSEKLSFFELTESQKTILFDIRLPRVLLGACVGVFKINADLLSRPAPRIVDALERIAKDLHPESFE